MLKCFHQDFQLSNTACCYGNSNVFTSVIRNSVKPVSIGNHMSASAINDLHHEWCKSLIARATVYHVTIKSSLSARALMSQLTTSCRIKPWKSCRKYRKLNTVATVVVWLKNWNKICEKSWAPCVQERRYSVASLSEQRGCFFSSVSASVSVSISIS